jgi:hypothetical protein
MALNLLAIGRITRKAEVSTSLRIADNAPGGRFADELHQMFERKSFPTGEEFFR